MIAKLAKHLASKDLKIFKKGNAKSVSRSRAEGDDTIGEAGGAVKAEKLKCVCLVQVCTVFQWGLMQTITPALASWVRMRVAAFSICQFSGPHLMRFECFRLELRPYFATLTETLNRALEAPRLQFVLKEAQHP